MTTDNTARGSRKQSPCTISFDPEGMETIAEVSAGASLSVGEQIGQYVVDKELKRGGMAVVYAGRDPVLNRSVAIKAIKPSFGWREGAQARFYLEARMLSSADHDSVVRLYQLVQHGKNLLMVMEMVIVKRLL